jgi:hypothetical protein
MILALLVWPVSAFAYVDPGSGMLLVQGLVALIGGIVAFCKNPAGWLRDRLRRLFKR